MIAALMPERIVDRLEMIEIDHQQGERAAGARRPHDLGPRGGEEAQPVRQAGQRIGRGEPFQAGLHRLAIRDVDHAGDQRPAGGQIDERGLDQHGAQLAVEAARLQFEIGHAPAAFQPLHQLLALLRIGVKLLERCGADHVRRDAEHGGAGIVHLQDQPVFAPGDDHPHGRGGEDLLHDLPTGGQLVGDGAGGVRRLPFQPLEALGP